MGEFFDMYCDIGENAFVGVIKNKISLSAHFHTNVELFYIADGSMTLMVSGKEYFLEAPAFAGVGSFEIHSVSVTENSTVYSASVPPSLVPDFWAKYKHSNFRRSYASLDEQNESIHNVFENFLSDFDQGDQFVNKGYAYILMSMAKRYLGFELISEAAEDSKPAVRELLRYVQDHYTENITLEKAATELGYHKDYLSRAFNETTKVGFCSYVNMVRVKFAVRLIENDNMSIEEIAFSSGFGNVHSFYDAFKTRYHCTPGQYKKRNLKQSLNI